MGIQLQAGLSGNAARTQAHKNKLHKTQCNIPYPEHIGTVHRTADRDRSADVGCLWPV